MKVIDQGHMYKVNSDQTITFIKRNNGELVWDGTTNEELIEVLIDRIKFLNNKFPCMENEMAVFSLNVALEALNERTAKRVAQGVETKDIAHVS